MDLEHLVRIGLPGIGLPVKCSAAAVSANVAHEATETEAAAPPVAAAMAQGSASKLGAKEMQLTAPAVVKVPPILPDGCCAALRPAMLSDYFTDVFDMDLGDFGIMEAGRVVFDAQKVTADDADRELLRLGFRQFTGLKSLAFNVGDDQDLVVCSILDAGTIDQEKLGRLHESRKPQLPSDLRHRYRELEMRAPPKPKGRPTPEDQEDLRAHRAEKRRLEEEAVALLRGWQVTAAHEARQIRWLKEGKDPLKTKVARAPEEMMEKLTGCARGGLHPVRHHYPVSSVASYLDSGSLQILAGGLWVVTGGGTPMGVYFLPIKEFWAYAATELIVAELAVAAVGPPASQRSDQGLTSPLEPSSQLECASVFGAPPSPPKTFADVSQDFPEAGQGKAGA